MGSAIRLNATRWPRRGGRGIPSRRLAPRLVPVQCVEGLFRIGCHWRTQALRVGLDGQRQVGLDFDLEQIPLQFYVEVAFAMSVFPGIFAGLDGGLGVRYYF